MITLYMTLAVVLLRPCTSHWSIAALVHTSDDRKKGWKLSLREVLSFSLRGFPSFYPTNKNVVSTRVRASCRESCSSYTGRSERLRGMLLVLGHACTVGWKRGEHVIPSRMPSTRPRAMVSLPAQCHPTVARSPP